MKCNKCHKQAVVKGDMFNSFEGVFKVCLNCGWYETAEYLEDEDVFETYRDTYEKEFKEMDKNGQIEVENK